MEETLCIATTPDAMDVDDGEFDVVVALRVVDVLDNLGVIWAIFPKLDFGRGVE